MSKPANFKILFRLKSAVVLRDNGPWEEHLTITNDIENVVQKLVESGDLLPGKQIHYYASDGKFTKALVKDGKFAGFRY